MDTATDRDDGGRRDDHAGGTSVDPVAGAPVDPTPGDDTHGDGTPAGRVKGLVGKVRTNTLARDSVWGMSLEGVSLMSTILVFSLLGRSLGPTDYGAYVSVFAVVNPMVTLTASGVSLALMEHAVRRQESLEQTARSSITMSLVLGSVLSVIGVLLALNIVEEISAVAAVTIVIGEFLVSPLSMIAAATLQSGSSFRDATKVRLATTIARTVVVVTLFAVGHLTVMVYVIVNVSVLLLVSIAALHQVGKKFGFRFLPGRFQIPMLKTNGTYSVGISAYSFQNDGEKTVMTANGLTTDTGLYSAAYRVVMMGLVPIGAFMSASHTKILEQVENEKGHHLRLSARFAAILGVYGLIFSIAAFFAAPLLPLLVGDAFEDSVEMMRWLSPIVFLRAIGATPVNGLLGLGRMGVRTLVIVAVAAISVVLYIVMIPIWGWKGAVIATMIGEVLNVVTAWTALVILQRRHDRTVDAESLAPPTPLETMS
jgi:O-antigen/teichoic acid export membrane protein